MVTLSSCLIWQIIRFIFPPIGFVKWVCDRLTDADFGKENHFFRWRSFWSWRVCKQAKLWNLEHRKRGRIYWKADAPKRVTVWAIFLPKWVNGDRYRAMLNEFLLTEIEEEDIGNIWLQQDSATCHAAEATFDVLHPVFEDRIISRRAESFLKHFPKKGIWRTLYNMASSKIKWTLNVKGMIIFPLA